MQCGECETMCYDPSPFKFAEFVTDGKERSQAGPPSFSGNGNFVRSVT
jgi:hypothetical protein